VPLTCHSPGCRAVRARRAEALAIFTVALGELAVAAGETLIAGDRASHDGPAVIAGIPTLLVPPLAYVNDGRPHLVLKMTGGPKT